MVQGNDEVVALYKPSTLQRVKTFLLAPLIVPINFLIRNLTWKDPATNPYLREDTNFGAVPIPEKDVGDGQEFLKMECRLINGKVPKELMGGGFLRNGPNARPGQDGLYHWFDGEGMIHGLRLPTSEGLPSIYSCHQLQTPFHLNEKRLSYYPTYMRIGWFFSKSWIFITKILWSLLIKATGYTDNIDDKFLGQANTSIELFGKRLMALHEGSLPFQFSYTKEGKLESLGVFNMNNLLNMNVTAHPKHDDITGETRLFGYDFENNPFFTYKVIKDDKVISHLSWNPKRHVMMHDFQITKNYSLVLDLPLIFSIERAKNGEKAIQYEPEKEARIGVFPKYATDESEIKWFRVQPCVIFHTIGSFEETNQKGEVLVHFMGCRLTEFELDDASVVKEGAYNHPWHWCFNMSTGLVEIEESLVGRTKEEADTRAPFNLDFPKIHPEKVGKKINWTYCSLFEKGSKDDLPLINGIAKISLEEGNIERRRKNQEGGAPIPSIKFDKGKYGGEAYFQPRANPKSEDDGFLLTFIHSSENWNITNFCIFDALTMSKSPIATIEIDCRIPFGMHCKFVTKEEIADVETCSRPAIITVEVNTSTEDTSNLIH